MARWITRPTSKQKVVGLGSNMVVGSIFYFVIITCALRSTPSQYPVLPGELCIFIGSGEL